jgi:hypothetical protein
MGLIIAFFAFAVFKVISDTILQIKLKMEYLMKCLAITAVVLLYVTRDYFAHGNTDVLAIHVQGVGVCAWNVICFTHRMHDFFLTQVCYFCSRA